MLLIHGLAAKAEVWEPLVSLLEKQGTYRLIAFDLLGFGRSPKPQHLRYTVHDHVSSVMASLERSVKDDKIIVIGHSMGCLIASHMATLYPNMVKRLILYEPPLFADSPEFRSHRKRRQFYFALYGMLIKRPHLYFRYSKLTNRRKKAVALQTSPDDWNAFSQSLQNTIMEQTAYKELRTITVPTDIIYGKYDFIVTRKEVKDMLKANPHIVFHLVKEMHDITQRSARYIDVLLRRSTPQPKVKGINA